MPNKETNNQKLRAAIIRALKLKRTKVSNEKDLYLSCVRWCGMKYASRPKVKAQIKLMASRGEIKLVRHYNGEGIYRLMVDD